MSVVERVGVVSVPACVLSGLEVFAGSDRSYGGALCGAWLVVDESGVCVGGVATDAFALGVVVRCGGSVGELGGLGRVWVSREVLVAAKKWKGYVTLRFDEAGCVVECDGGRVSVGFPGVGVGANWETLHGLLSGWVSGDGSGVVPAFDVSVLGRFGECGRRLFGRREPVVQRVVPGEGGRGAWVTVRQGAAEVADWSVEGVVMPFRVSW